MRRKFEDGTIVHSNNVDGTKTYYKIRGDVSRYFRSGVYYNCDTWPVNDYKCNWLPQTWLRRASMAELVMISMLET